MLSIPESKTCTKCGQSNPATTEHFYAHPLGKMGLNPRCKQCVRARFALSYRANPDASRARSRKSALASYYKNHEANKAKSKELRRLERQDPAVRAARAARAKANYAACDKAVYAAKVKAYKALHPEMVSAWHRTDKARRKLAVGSHTGADIEAQLAKQEGRCFYCSAALTSYHVDHFIPLAKGGTNWPSNLVCACPSCNLQKGCTMPHEFRKSA